MRLTRRQFLLTALASPAAVYALWPQADDLVGAPGVLPDPDPAIGGAAKPLAKPPRPWSTPIDAVGVARFDANERVAKADLPFTRWIWSRTGDMTEWQALAYVFGLITNGSSIGVQTGNLLLDEQLANRPIPRGIVARIDLRWYAPKVADLVRWIGLWDQLAFDPSFNFILTEQLIKLLSEEQRMRIAVPVKEDGWTLRVVDGRRIYSKEPRTRWVGPAEALQSVPVVRVTPRLLIEAGMEELQNACLTAAPIVELDYFVARALSTITHALDEDENVPTVFSTVWGGQYYDWINVPRGDGKKISDLDALLGYLGISDGKTPFQQVFDKLRSDERLVTTQSKVTGKRRLTTLIYSPKERPSMGASLLAITSDIRDTDVDLDTDALVNFIFAVAKAHEVLWLDVAGFQRGTIYNGAGKLVKVVPADVASDRTIPAPHTQNLEPMISCLRCHAPFDGWQPVENNIATAFRFNPKQVLALEADQRDRVLGWYFGDHVKVLNRARLDYAAAVLRATGDFPPALDGPLQMNTVKVGSALISEMVARDRYRQVDAGLALQTLGLPKPASNAEALATFRRLFPERLVHDGVVLDDMRLEMLRASKLDPATMQQVPEKINARDWALIYWFALERAVSQAAKEQP